MRRSYVCARENIWHKLVGMTLEFKQGVLIEVFLKAFV